jgi:hypothetical protein
MDGLELLISVSGFSVVVGMVLMAILNNSIEDLEFKGIKLKKKNRFVYFRNALVNDYIEYKKVVNNVICGLVTDLKDVYTDLYVDALREQGHEVIDFTTDPRVKNYMRILDSSLERVAKQQLTKCIFSNGFPPTDSEGFRITCQQKTKDIYKNNRDYITRRWEGQTLNRELFIKEYLASEANVTEINRRVYQTFKGLIDHRNMLFKNLTTAYKEYDVNVIEQQWEILYGHH